MSIYYEYFDQVSEYFEDFACEQCCYSDDDDCDEKCEEWLTHTFRVFALCSVFINSIDTNIIRVNKDVLFKASILHDIAKPLGKKNHHKRERLRYAIKETNIDITERQKKAICAIIEAHKGPFKPPESLLIEAAILRICDKLDKFQKNRKKAAVKIDKTMNKIEKRFKEYHTDNEWEVFYRVCEQMTWLILRLSN